MEEADNSAIKSTGGRKTGRPKEKTGLQKRRNETRGDLGTESKKGEIGTERIEVVALLS